MVKIGDLEISAHSPGIVATIQSPWEIVYARKVADLLELRLDLIQDHAFLKRLRETMPKIATLRWERQGGRFRGDLERLDILAEIVDHVDCLDLEYGSQAAQRIREIFHGPLILSHHDFRGMPSPPKLEGLIKEMLSRAQIAKLALTPRSALEAVELLSICSKFRNVCIIPLGEMGAQMRLLSLRYGSVLGYGYVSKPVAPGQPSIYELREFLREASTKLK